jgi:citrate lyase beta subunit
MPTSTHLRLGASLYVPATRESRNLVEIANGERLPELRSVIFCTEDAVRPDEVDVAIAHLAEMLPHVRPSEKLRFLRVRNPAVMGRLLQLRGIANVDGFVLPKTTASVLPSYLELLTGRDPFLLMPTLETAEVFDAREMHRLRDLVSDDHVRPRIISLRIGGNDLLHQIGVRRDPARTIYDTAMGPVISQLATTFIPHGFNLTGPVFEAMSHPEVLREEIARDMLNGLMGKTAIHPTQIPLIESQYRVRAKDLEMAKAMLAHDAPAVFRMHDVMCEAATHWKWARQIAARAAIYGVEDERALHVA